MRPSQRVVPRVFLVVVLALLGGLLVAPHGSAAVLGDDYPANLKKYARDAKVDPWRFYNRECTSFVAWRINDALDFPFDDYWLVHWGNASNWKKAATSTAVKNAGVTVDSIPTVGSVAWWSANSAGSSLGHVAWVAEVSSTSITIEEYNYARAGYYGTRVITTGSSKWPGAFIHFKPVTITNTAAPAITGTPKVGVALTASTGSWSVASLTYAYQWYAGGVAVAGATTKTFKPTAAQLGKTVTVKVTAARSGLKSVAKSSVATAVVAAGTLKRTAVPTVSGTPKVGVALTATPGTWSPAAVSTYQWSAAGTPISGATGSTYTPGPAEVGKTIAVTVTATRAGYLAAKATSAVTAAVAKGDFVNTVAPAVVGTPRVGATVSAAPGTWNPVGTYHYQWRSDGTAIAGATDSAYTPVPRDLGKGLSVTVTATSAGYHYATKTAHAVTVEPGRFVDRAAPTLSGTPQVGATLHADPGTWAPLPGAVAYKWYVGGKFVPGATKASYTARPTDRDKVVTLVVTVTRAAYDTATAKVSSATRVAAGVNTATRPPAISGSAMRGATLTVSPGTWRVTPATRRYQWYADGIAIKGATGRTLKLATAQVGHRITVTESVTATGYESARATSAATGKVLYGTVSFTRKPTMTGSTHLGSVLTLHPGTVAPAGARLAYQWYRDGAAIRGATGKTYRSVPLDLGRRISARVVATAPSWRSATARAGTAADVRSVPRARLASTVHGRSLTLDLQITAPSVPAVGGTVVVRDGSRRIAKVVVKRGKAHLRVKHLRTGKRHLRISYSGTAKVLPVTLTRTVRIRS